jgi:hypothetical protein
MKAVNTRLLWFFVPALIALGAVAFALLRPTVDCIRSADVVACSDTGLVNVLVATGGVLLAAVITAFLLRTRRSR